MWDPGCLVGCVTDVQDLWVWHSMACIFYNSVLWHLSAVNNVYNLVTWKGTRKNNLAWTCMDNIDHASRNLSSSSMRRAAAASAWRNERTYNTHATNESFFVQENMAKQSDQQIQQSTRCRNESHDLWRSLTISWDVFGRMVPLRAAAPPLGVSPSRGIRPSRLEHSWMRIFANVNAATCCDQPSHLQPPLSMFANMKWHRNGFPHLLLGETLLWISNNSRYSIWNQAVLRFEVQEKICWFIAV